jgi:hypothetical protein
LILAITAFFVLITGIWANENDRWGGAVSGIAMYFAIFILVAITSANDWAKDKQFVRLQEFIKDELITVIRGKFGAT